MQLPHEPFPRSEAPYREAALPQAADCPDTRRALAATWLTLALLLLVAGSLLLPVVDGRSVGMEAWRALEDGSLLAPLVVASILAVAAGGSALSLRAALCRCPPLRVERRAICLGVLAFVLENLIVGHTMVHEAATIRLALVLPVIWLPLAAAATVAAWKCGGWEGWAYALGAIALTLAGCSYTTAILTARAPAEAGTYVFLGAVAGLVAIAGWALAPIARSHDAYTYVGMGAVAVALDALAMLGLALLQGVRPTADLSPWWESYFAVQRALAFAGVGTAIASLALGRRRRYGLISVGLLALLALLFRITPS